MVNKIESEGAADRLLNRDLSQEPTAHAPEFPESLGDRERGIRSKLVHRIFVFLEYPLQFFDIGEVFQTTCSFFVFKTKKPRNRDSRG